MSWNSTFSKVKIKVPFADYDVTLCCHSRRDKQIKFTGLNGSRCSSASTDSAVGLRTKKNTPPASSKCFQFISSGFTESKIASGQETYDDDDGLWTMWHRHRSLTGRIKWLIGSGCWLRKWAIKSWMSLGLGLNLGFFFSMDWEWFSQVLAKNLRSPLIAFARQPQIENKSTQHRAQPPIG